MADSLDRLTIRGFKSIIGSNLSDYIAGSGGISDGGASRSGTFGSVLKRCRSGEDC